jgi:hypothetical protein
MAFAFGKAHFGGVDDCGVLAEILQVLRLRASRFAQDDKV